MSDVQVANLDELLRDPLNADMSQFMGEPEPEKAADAKAADDQGEKDGATPGADDQQAQAKKDEPPGEPDNAVIKTKDGKHEIPYSVLQAERTKAKQLEQQLAELSNKLANAQVERESGKEDRTPEVSRIISPEQLEQLKEDAPQLHAMFSSLIGEIETLKQTATRVETTEQERQAEIVQEAIDATPKLAYVQSSDPAKFSAIAEIDTWMRSQDQFKALSLGARFDKAVAMYEAAHGPIALPDSASGSKGKATVDAQAKAAAAIAKAMEKTAPNTLTDIPGGNPPPSNDLEAMDGMSAAALTAHLLEGKTNIDDFLRKFA